MPKPEANEAVQASAEEQKAARRAATYPERFVVSAVFGV